MQELQTHMSCDNQSLMHDTGIVANKMLKTLLSHSTASLDEQQQKMITTTEVTDKQLNLRKILYETDRSNCDKEGDMLHTSQQTPSNNDNNHNDDDDRLVIDISDDEHSSSNNNNNNNNYNNNNNERSKGKSMPLLVDVGDLDVYKKRKISGSEMPTASITSKNKPLVLRQCSLPKSIYLNTSESGVKIDILTPINSQPNQNNQSQSQSFTSTLKSSLRESTLSQSSSSQHHHRASSPLTTNDELEMINNEIDLLFDQKSSYILTLLTEFISNRITRNIFENKMKLYCDITLTDLVTVTKNLIKKYKFEPNQNYKEFSKIKYLQFPTTYHNLVNYFDNVLKTISQQQFLNILKLYEIIIKEMMNINKTKVIQYLLDFMIIRKNMDLDMLNYNYKTNYALSIQQNEEQQIQYPDSTNSSNVLIMEPSSDDSFQYLSHNFSYIHRSNLTWQTAKSQFFTSVKSLCKTRMSSAEQSKRYVLRPFDNNHRGKPRGLKAHSVEDEAELNNIKLGMHKRQQQLNHLKNQHLQAALRAPTQQEQQQQQQLQQQQLQLQQLQRQQQQQQQQQQLQQQQQQRLQMPQRQHSPVLIVVDSPPQTSPPYHQNVKIPPQIQVVPQQEVPIQRPILIHQDPALSIEHIRQMSSRQMTVNNVVEIPAEITVIKPTRKPPPRRQTIHERQIIAEPPMALNLAPTNVENLEVQRKGGKKIARRQSCHERTQMNPIERNCVSFLNEFESKVAENGIREIAELKKQLQRTQDHLRIQKEQQKIHEEKQNYSNRPPGQPKKAVRFNDEHEHQKLMANQVNYITNQPENLQRIYQAVSSTEQMDQQQRQLRFERMQAREISQYNSQMDQQQQQLQQQHQHIRDRSPVRQSELIMREHLQERHLSDRLHQQQKQQQQQYAAPSAHRYVHESLQRNYERAVQQEQFNQQHSHREMVEDGSPVHLIHSHQQYVDQMKGIQQYNGRQQQQQQQLQQHHHQQQQQQQPIQVRLSGPSRDEHQDCSPETLYYSQEIRQSPQTYQNTSSSSTSSVTRMVSPPWQLPSREQSPIEYEQHDQQVNKLSLQRKTLMKVKNKTKYVEPNQNHNPFYHSAPLTYYSNPYIFTRPQATVEPTPIQNKSQNSFENLQNNSIPQLHQSVVHQTSYPPSQFPYYAAQRFPLPPVPPFKEIAKKIESGAVLHRPGYPEPPTEFLRKFYTKNY